LLPFAGFFLGTFLGIFLGTFLSIFLGIFLDLRAFFTGGSTLGASLDLDIDSLQGILDLDFLFFLGVARV
jgi:hypothetical protein